MEFLGDRLEEFKDAIVDQAQREFVTAGNAPAYKAISQSGRFRGCAFSGRLSDLCQIYEVRPFACATYAVPKGSQHMCTRAGEHPILDIGGMQGALMVLDHDDPIAKAHGLTWGLTWGIAWPIAYLAGWFDQRPQVFGEDCTLAPCPPGWFGDMEPEEKSVAPCK
jgi:Fe-S-cluster containining protein